MSVILNQHLRHPRSGRSLEGVKFHLGHGGRIEGEADPEEDALDFFAFTSSSSTFHSTAAHFDVIGALLRSINMHKMNLYSEIMLLLAFIITRIPGWMD